jgi:hypothetical protein
MMGSASRAPLPERIAVREEMRQERACEWRVESVEEENRRFDLISRKPHPHDERTFTEVRFIAVGGRAGVGDVALSANEFKTVQRLGPDYRLLVLCNCATTPVLPAVRDPARPGWKPVVKVKHHRVGAREIAAGGSQTEDAPC